ncbi:GIY-YIG nuclease family protein [Aestuariirhabdus litorea]|uniref:GIY-YIG nuclease family protein n=1 Tax=Aestuariirhabdus litorea TaxID=2528527 RepID=A0A3P3VQZ4_9GAMM|nr:GIY-YIG nuclease family protein [Aestuariirhabdus litorea]RRJ83243.1 hypothetical protein D0544_15535 [Aestuariirhabdus litorea]RWW93400.1 hypothetical protein DZC74_15505 [Endozoicomonadaceae bacterium GTF-13]
MIVFTVSNRSTGKTYVGTTRNPLLLQWEKIVEAAESGLDYPLYREIRAQGADNFQLEEWDYTDDRSELQELEREALEALGAESLKGYKTAVAAREPAAKKPRTRTTAKRSAPKANAEPAAGASPEASGPLTHINAAGEAVVRFDGKRTSVEDAIAGIGNRVPEFTVVDPLARSRAGRPAMTAPEVRALERVGEESEAPLAAPQPASRPEPEAAPLTSTIEPPPPEDESPRPSSESVIAEAMATLKRLQAAPEASHSTPPADPATPLHRPQEREQEQHLRRLREAIERQRASERSQRQKKQFTRQQVERIEALEQLALQKMGRLGSAA